MELTESAQNMLDGTDGVSSKHGFEVVDEDSSKHCFELQMKADAQNTVLRL
ncbi:chlorohydrolase [Streptococcus pneumoniae]|nr:chlorohydrolase [Streptococcus pneumoniae]